MSNDATYYPNMDFDIWLRSCDYETSEPLKGTTTGVIPLWINGSLIHNGPGRFQFGDYQVGHFFDGSAFLHRFSIENGTVKYQSKFVQTEVYKQNKAANRIVVTEFGTEAVPDPCQTIFQRIAAYFLPKSSTKPDNTMVSVYPLGDDVYAFGEYTTIYRINPKNLETEKQVDVGDYISIVHHSSHPHVTEDGSVYNLGLSTNHKGRPHHVIVKFPSNNTFDQATIVAEVPTRWSFWPSYMHSFGITENYFILVEQPLTLSVPHLTLAKFRNKPVKAAIQWYPNIKTQFSLISRQSGALAYKFCADTFFYMHIVNQYEISDYLVIDICTYRDAAALDAFYTESLKTILFLEWANFAEMLRTKTLRFVLPLNPHKSSSKLIELEDTEAEAIYLPNGEILLKPEEIVDVGCETPTINYEKYSGKPYRYFYAVGADIDAPNPGKVIKVDTRTKKSQSWSEDNCYLTEPIFVPRPNSEREDDGVVLTAMLWGKKDSNRVGLLVLDAGDFTEIGRVEFRTPGVVPRRVHGKFFAKQMQK